MTKCSDSIKCRPIADGRVFGFTSRLFGKHNFWNSCPLTLYTNYATIMSHNVSIDVVQCANLCNITVDQESLGSAQFTADL